MPWLEVFKCFSKVAFPFNLTCINFVLCEQVNILINLTVWHAYANMKTSATWTGSEILLILIVAKCQEAFSGI